MPVTSPRQPVTASYFSCLALQKKTAPYGAVFAFHFYILLFSLLVPIHLIELQVLIDPFLLRRNLFLVGS